MKFKIYDLVSRKHYATVVGKNNADMKLVELMKQYPNRKFHLKMEVIL